MSLSNMKTLSEFDALNSAPEVLTALNHHYYEMGDGLLIITPIWAIGDFGSLHYNPENGHWSDSFTDSIGHNLISLLMYLEEMHATDAAILMMDIHGGGALRTESALPNRDLNLRYSIPRLTKQLISTKFGRFTKNLNY